MAKRAAILASTLVALCGVAPAAHAATEAPPSYLFVVNSERGTIDGVGKDVGTEKLTLTLRGVNDHATQFADRPIRRAYVLSTRDLVARWKRWFADSPPNAVLTFNRKRDHMPHSIVVKLRHPRYDAKAETLTFAARHIHRASDLSPDAIERVALPHRRPPAMFIRGSLFIDSVFPTRYACQPLPNADCPGVDWSGRNLAGAKLYNGNFSGANLSGADLRGAELNNANLSGANLRGANLKGADLGMANLTDADLTDATLTRTQFSYTKWVDGRTCAGGSKGACL